MGEDVNSIDFCREERQSKTYGRSLRDNLGRPEVEKESE